MRTWRVVLTIKHEVEIKAIDAKSAEIKARGQYTNVVDVNVGWIDDMNISHMETCPGTHCRHYSCTYNDTPLFCTQCDPDVQ